MAGFRETMTQQVRLKALRQQPKLRKVPKVAPRGRNAVKTVEELNSTMARSVPAVPETPPILAAQGRRAISDSAPPDPTWGGW